MGRMICCATVLCCTLGAAALAEANWPCFRGLSCGVAEDAVLQVSWSATENVAWKVDIPGRGWSFHMFYQPDSRFRGNDKSHNPP